jgi:uncharacterized protein (DUF486 family)
LQHRDGWNVIGRRHSDGSFAIFAHHIIKDVNVVLLSWRRAFRSNTTEILAHMYTYNKSQNGSINRMANIVTFRLVLCSTVFYLQRTAISLKIFISDRKKLHGMIVVFSIRKRFKLLTSSMSKVRITP